MKRLRNPALGAGSLVGGELLVRLIGPLLTLLVVKELGPSEFGVYAAALAILNVLSIITSIGIEPAVTKAVAEGAGLRDALRVGFQWAALLTLAALSLLGVWLALRSRMDKVAITAISMTGYLLASSLAAVVTGAYQGAGRYGASGAFTSLVGIVTWLGVGIVLLLNVTSAPVVGGVQATAFLLASGLAAGMLWRKSRDSSSDVQVSNRGFVRDMRTFMATSSLFHVYNRSDSAILASVSRPVEVGAYTIAYRATELIFALPSLIFTKVFYSKFFKWGAEDPTRLRLYVRLTSKALGLMSGFLVMGFAILGPPALVMILGTEHSYASDLLRYLAWVIPLQFLSAPTGALLITQGHVRPRIIVQGVTLVANLSINYALIPTMGAVGAAIAMIASAAIHYVGTQLTARTHAPGLSTTIGEDALACLPTAIAAAAVIAAAYGSHAVSIAAYLICTLALIILGGTWFRSDERRELSSVLRPKSRNHPEIS